MKHLGLLKQFLLLFVLIVGSGSAWADGSKTYQHIFTTKPSTGNSVALSTINWNISASNLNGFQSSYAGVQVGAKNKNGSLAMTSSSDWGEQTQTNYTGYTNVKEVRIWLNAGTAVPSATVSIGGISATSDGTTVVKNSSASSYEDATKVTYTPASNGKTGAVVINVTTTSGAGYICAIEIECEEPNGGGGGQPVTDSSAAVTFDFTDADAWGWPSEYTTTEESYTNDGYTFTLGASSTGHKKVVLSDVVKSLIFGKKDATLVFPEFSFNVNKIKIYGYSGASGATTFNIFVDDEAIFEDDFSSCKIDHEINIPTEYQAAGTIYVYKITNANNAQVSKIEIFGYENVAVTTAGLATFASDNNLDFTNVEGLEANSAKINGNTVTFESVATVPAGEGVLLKATEELTETATFAVPVVSSVTEWAASDNDFIRGNNVAVPSTVDNTNNYILSTNASGVVGFYLAAGKTIPKNRAYLSTTSTGAPALDMNWGEGTTGIVNVNRETMINNQYYTLDGRRVAQPTKGLYIFNGKKVVIK